jgi:hypothetical protein
MEIQIKILDGKSIRHIGNRTLNHNFIPPLIIKVKGDYALELALSRIIETYYGAYYRIALEELLKVRLPEEQIAKQIEMFLEQ